MEQKRGDALSDAFLGRMSPWSTTFVGRTPPGRTDHDAGTPRKSREARVDTFGASRYISPARRLGRGGLVLLLESTT